MLVIIIIAVIVALIAIYVWHKKKALRYGNLTLISGGVKTGKTELSVCLCLKQYRKQLRKWRRACRIAKRKYQPFPEKPLLYSNMPIGKKGMSYAPITLEHMSGKKRFRYGSVIYFNEVSFIAGSMDFKNDEVNDFLLQFYKLCAHSTRGGYFIIDTQAPQDMHFSIKRSLSTYFFILRRVTLPFVSLLWVREELFVDGEKTVAVDKGIDPQDKKDEGGKPFYFLVLRNKWWKYYDQYAYSVLTDHLPVGDKTVTIETQKVNGLLRIKHLIERRKHDKK